MACTINFLPLFCFSLPLLDAFDGNYIDRRSLPNSDTSDLFSEDVWAGPVLNRSLPLFLRGLVSAFWLMVAITRSLMQSSSFPVVSLPNLVG